MTFLPGVTHILLVSAVLHFYACLMIFFPHWLCSSVSSLRSYLPVSDDKTTLVNLFLEHVEKPESYLDTRVLRSCATSPRVAGPLSFSDALSTNLDAMARFEVPAVSESSLPPMKVLQTTYNVSQFGCSDSSFSAHDFITQFEDDFSSVMVV